MILGPIGADRGTTEALKAGFLSGGSVAVPETLSEILIAADDAIATPSHYILPASTGSVLRAFADIFYFRIWPLPSVLDVQNPKRGVPIPFQLWNAFLGPETLNVITPTNADGLTLDITTGDVFARLEMRTVHATIGADAPNQIDALFNFAFDDDDATLRFLALLAEILPIFAEDQITEKLEWKTDVLQNYDGSEQRIALRQRPRRQFIMDYTLTDEADRKLLYDKLFKTSGLTVVAPAYQYQSRLKVSTVIGDNKLYTNTRRADLRAGESVLITTKDDVHFLYTIDQVFSDYVTITTAFSQVIKKGAIVCGAFDGRYPNKSGLGMMALGGHAQLSVLLSNPRPQVSWPDVTIPIPTFNSKPLLLRRPLADEEAKENFDVGLDTIDNETGKPAYYTSWTQPFMEGDRKWLIQTLFEPDELEFWRTFLDTVKGKQKSFYTPTFRQDLEWDDSNPFLVGQIHVKGTEYATQYFGKPAYDQLQIETDVGTFEVSIDNVVNLGDRTRLNFVTPIPVDVSTATVLRISYLMLVRLGGDEVSLVHYPLYSTVNAALRMAVA